MLDSMLSGSVARAAPSRMPGLISAGFAVLRDQVAVLRRRAEERRQLLALDERELRDVGLARCDAVAEAMKSLWKP